MSGEYQICTRCVMDTTDPAIVFDAQGVCNHCHGYDDVIHRCTLSGPAADTKVREIVDLCKRNGRGRNYDCVIGVSGGVDSTYVAYKVKELGLRSLAVHVDNGWDSELAVKNIQQICRKLGIDLHTIVLDWEEFRDLQLAFMKSGTPDLEVPSDHAIMAGMLQTAKSHGVAHIITGLNARTESHVPSTWSQGHSDWRYVNSVYRRFGSGRLSTFPHLSFLDVAMFRYPRWIDLLNYVDYSKKNAIPVLEREIGWRYYGGKHYESIYTRWYQGFWLPRRFGYDKRRAHLSSLVCSGEMPRDQAMRSLQEPTYDPKLQEEDTTYVMKKLGLSVEEIERLLGLPKKSYRDYPSYGWVYRTWHYRILIASARWFLGCMKKCGEISSCRSK